MYKRVFWLFSGFFTFSALASEFELPLNKLTPSERQEPADRLLYRNNGTGTTVIGKPVEMPASIKNTLQALAYIKPSDLYSIFESERGFFVTKRIFVHWTEYESLIQRQTKPLHLLQRRTQRLNISITQQLYLERQDSLKERLRTQENAFFKEVGTVSNLIGVFQNQWASFEVNGYEGPIVELADFNKTNTDDIYFLTVTKGYEFDHGFIIVQVTGIENDMQADHLELQSIRTATINRDRGSAWQQRVLGVEFSPGGIAVNSEGKVIGFLVNRFMQSQLHLIKVTPELRKFFSENIIAEARESTKKTVSRNDGCSSPLFREF